MAPALILSGKIQVLGETCNSVVYALASDSDTGRASDSITVLKGAAVWFEGKNPFGEKKDADEADRGLRHEARIYEALGAHARIITYHGLETSADLSSKAWALRLERAPHGNVRAAIVLGAGTPRSAPDMATRMVMAAEFAEGVAHVHACDVVWGDLSTRNALLFDGWHLKLCDFADSAFVADYHAGWYGCEIRYCPPGLKPNHHAVNTKYRELFALGTAIFELTEWRIPYGAATPDRDIAMALARGEWLEPSNDNPARDIIQRCWRYQYDSAQEVVDDLHAAQLRLVPV